MFPGTIYFCFLNKSVHTFLQKVYLCRFLDFWVSKIQNVRREGEGMSAKSCFLSIAQHVA